MSLTSTAPVTREQFEIRSEVEVVHVPTGAVFRAYPYKTPDDMLQSVRVNWGRSVVQADYAEQIRHMASQLLLELKDVNSRRRPAFFA
jgi:hypothetical protein